jgi:acetylornithine deacetylase/succinyl-diaminopimelate desuccinylase-like protein
MVIPRGYKGGVCRELECKGGEWGGTVDGRHTWAGHAPWVDAPMMRLVHAVGSLFDADHNVAIDGVDAFVLPLSDEDRAELELLRNGFNDDLERMMKAIIGVKKFRGGKTVPELMERWASSVAINVQGIVGGYMGPTFYTMLPQAATAKLDFRVPPGLEYPKLLELLRAHLDRRGFTEIEIKNQRGYESQRTPGSDPIIQAGIRAAAMHGVPTVAWPTTNAFCPAGLFARPPLGLPSSWVGLGHGERPHQPDEYICVDAIRQYMQFAVTYLHEWAKV